MNEKIEACLLVQRSEKATIHLHREGTTYRIDDPIFISWVVFHFAYLIPGISNILMFNSATVKCTPAQEYRISHINEVVFHSNPNQFERKSFLELLESFCPPDHVLGVLKIDGDGQGEFVRQREVFSIRDQRFLSWCVDNLDMQIRCRPFFFYYVVSLKFNFYEKEIIEIESCRVNIYNTEIIFSRSGND